MLRLARLVLVAAVWAPNALAAGTPPTQEQLVSMLATLDHRMSFPVDYSAKIYLEMKRQGQADRVWGLTILRRDKDDNLIMLFTKPKTEAGKGTLRIDKNLWSYDPTTGKWDRQTERDRVAGTGARRRDFDDWDLASTYDPTYVQEEKLGAFLAHKVKLTAKPAADVAFPLMHLWVDTTTGNPLKIEAMSGSGKVAQTTFYPKWVETKIPNSTTTVYYPKETRIKDNLDNGSQTLILVQESDLRPLPANIFTKAWFETQSR